MSLKLVSLASGSKGNSTLILSDNTALLVDAGISYTRICKELKPFGLNVDMLDGIVVTHEHADHICALPKLAEHTKIYAHPLTSREMCVRLGGLKNLVDVDNYENGFSVGDIKVSPFRIPHDAAYPLAYTFCACGGKVSVATDIGRPTIGVFNNISKSQIVLLEANHDVEMLKNGKYSPWLKDRILSDKGHLSNDATAIIAERLVGTEVREILLGHLSENNNLPNLAFETVKEKVEARGGGINLSVASQKFVSEVFETE